MIRFICKLSLYLIPLLVLGTWAEIRARQIPNNYSLKAHLFSNFPASEIETLILGSSHSLKGINPARLSSRAFNYAHVSQRYDIDLLILKSSEFTRLNTVILPVSLFSFYNLPGENPQLQRLRKYAVYTPLDVPAPAWDHFAIRNWTEVRGALFNISDSSLCSIEANGWEPMSAAESEVDLTRTTSTAFESHTKYGTSIDADALRSFEAIVDWCDSKNVRLVVVSIPVWKAYRDLAIGSIQWKQTKSVLKRYRTIQFLNWMENPPIGMSLEDFHDADHLSAAGANKLSIALNDWIESEPRLNDSRLWHEGL